MASSKLEKQLSLRSAMKLRRGKVDPDEDDDNDFPDVTVTKTLSKAEALKQHKKEQDQKKDPMPPTRRKTSGKKAPKVKSQPKKTKQKEPVDVLPEAPAAPPPPPDAPSALAVLQQPPANLPSVAVMTNAAVSSKKLDDYEASLAVADLRSKVQEGQVKVVAAGPLVAKVVDTTTDKSFLVPKAALTSAPFSGPCDPVAALAAYQRILGEGYFAAYGARLKRRYEDLNELWKFGLLHPADYEEWKKDFEAFPGTFNQMLQDFENKKDFCSPAAVVGLQRQMARTVRSLLHRYERFRTRVLNSGQYLRNVDSYCRTIKKESCGASSCAKVQGPCVYKKDRWYAREPSKAAMEYVGTVAGFNVENDCLGKEHQLLKTGDMQSSQFNAAEAPYAQGFVQAYRAHYNAIRDVVTQDREELYSRGYLSTEDEAEQRTLAREVFIALAQNDNKLFGTSGEVIAEQQRMSNVISPFVQQARALRDKALHSSSYRKNLARVCKTKRDNKSRCETEPGCTFDTKGTWFSGPRGCIVKTKPHSKTVSATLKTVEDCD